GGVAAPAGGRRRLPDRPGIDDERAAPRRRHPGACPGRAHRRFPVAADQRRRARPTAGDGTAARHRHQRDARTRRTARRHPHRRAWARRLHRAGAAARPPRGGDMSEAIRLVLVDDQQLVRAGLRPLAERDGDIHVVGEAADGRSGLSRVRELRPDLVLMDLRMPVMDGLEATRAAAAGYLLKDIAPDALREAIRTVAAGDALLSPAVTAAVMRAAVDGGALPADRRPLEHLTEREIEVLTLIGRGRTNAEIASELFLSPATSRTYVSRLLSRLGARDRAALVVLAYETGLVRPGR